VRLLSQVVSNLPFFAAYLVAAVLALGRWNRHPMTSVLVLTGAGISVFARLATLALPAVLAAAGGDAGSTLWLGFALTGLLSSAGLACLVAAVFTDRSTKSDPPAQPR